MKIIANFGTLMKLASKLGKAKKKGDKEIIKKAQEEHDNYKQICLEADEMQI